MLTKKELDEIEGRAREGWIADGYIKLSTGEVGSLVNEVRASRLDKPENPRPILTKVELEAIETLRKLERIVYYNNSYSAGDRILFIDTIEQAQRIIYAAAMKGMKPGVSYQIDMPPQEKVSEEQDAAARPMSIADMKKKNELRVDPLGRGEKPSCQSSPSTLRPDITTPASESPSTSAEKKPPLQDLEVGQSSE